MNVHLFAIDPQNSFTDENTGTLYVPGGQDDMERLASFIADAGSVLKKIHITLDQHHTMDISHPLWFVDDNGDEPPPFTIMRYDDGNDCFMGSIGPDYQTERRYRTRKRGLHAYTKWYEQQIASSGRYPHCIWPVHCEIGHEGSDIYPAVMEAAREWAEKNASTINFVAKGSNPFTEHYSAVKAEVPLTNPQGNIPADPSTGINTPLIQTLETADLILVPGEALSHCVANTIRDVIAEFGNPAYVKKLVILTDCCSNVTGFENLGEDFLKEGTDQGMQTMTCSDALAMLNI